MQIQKSKNKSLWLKFCNWILFLSALDLIKFWTKFDVKMTVFMTFNYTEIVANKVADSQFIVLPYGNLERI